MPTLKRGIGARLGGMETFLNLKKVFDDALRQKQWENEKTLFEERNVERRSLRSERGATTRSLISAGYNIPQGDLANMLAGGDVNRWTPPTPKSTMTAGERGNVNKVLQILSDREYPTNKGVIRIGNKREAESIVRMMGLDPAVDPRIKVMINQYPETGKRVAGGNWWERMLPGGYATSKPIPIPDTTEIETVVKQFEAGDKNATQELLRLIEEGVVQYNPDTNEISY